MKTLLPVEEEHLIYLDELRESGRINMLGAPAYLEKVFGVTQEHSFEIFRYWKATFTKRQAEKSKTVRKINEKAK